MCPWLGVNHARQAPGAWRHPVNQHHATDDESGKQPAKRESDHHGGQSIHATVSFFAR